MKPGVEHREKSGKHSFVIDAKCENWGKSS